MPTSIIKSLVFLHLPVDLTWSLAFFRFFFSSHGRNEAVGQFGAILLELRCQSKFLNSVYLVLKNQFPETGHGRYLMTVILALGKLRQEDCHKLDTSLGFVLNSRSPNLNTLISQPKTASVLVFLWQQGKRIFRGPAPGNSAWVPLLGNSLIRSPNLSLPVFSSSPSHPFLLPLRGYRPALEVKWMERAGPSSLQIS